MSTPLVIGLHRPIGFEQAKAMREKLRELIPGCDPIFVEDCTGVWMGPHVGDDLTIAAALMHEALYREGEWLNSGPAEVIVAFDRLQAAMRARGWHA